MKYSNILGIVAALILIGLCFAPWVYIQSIDVTITGLHAQPTSYGRPGMVNIIMSVVAIVLFLTPVVGAKRVNLFINAFNIAWTMRNFLLITQCELGECPEKKLAIYVIPVLAVFMLIMSMLPDLKVKATK